MGNVLNSVIMVTIVPLMVLPSPHVKNVTKKTVLIVLVMPPSVPNVLKDLVYLLMVNVMLVPLVSLNVCPDVPPVLPQVLLPQIVVLIVMVKIVLMITFKILMVHGLMFLYLLKVLPVHLDLVLKVMVLMVQIL